MITTATSAFYDISINNLQGEPIDLSTLKGKKILIVNVASKCGFTSQYKDLQKLQDRFKNQLVVIGVPCNQFGHQESGAPEEIREFCDVNYKINFLMTEKINVKGEQQHPLYQWLTDKTLNGKNSSTVKWNFQKYLLDEDGQLIDHYYSITNPSSSRIVKYIE
ncbi:glutathione peroxidase [Winogradskyella rapida]|uniref:Glutathione peroxidase n=1 Tax=Winogradskyella rapida TaxID=549701 RepID=A0ABW3KLQ9_9FLAO